MKKEEYVLNSKFPKCIYCKYYALWDGDNVCFKDTEPKIIIPQNIVECDKFKIKTTGAKSALYSLFKINEDKFCWWLKTNINH